MRINPRAIGHKHESSKTAGRPHGALGTSAIRPGELVEPAGTRTQQQVTRDSWLTPWVFGPGPEWPGIAGRTQGPSDLGPIGPGQLVEHTGPRARTRVDRENWSTTGGPRIRAKVARDIWSKLLAFGPGPDTSGTAGGPHGHSHTSASVPGELVDSACPRSWAEIARDICLTPWGLGNGSE